MPAWDRHGDSRQTRLFFVFLVEPGVFLFKFLNSTSGINKFLFPGEKRMAGGTDFNLHFFVYRTKFYGISAGTNCGDFMVFWMNIRFHIFTSMQK